MGFNDPNRSGKARGNTGDAKVLSFRPNGKVLADCKWEDVSPSLLTGVVLAVTSSGAAIMFGLTSDGGAYSICILDGDRKAKIYPHGAEECEEELEGIIAHYAPKGTNGK